MKAQASALLLGLSAIYQTNAQAWNHAHQGDDWEGIGQCGHNERQSPIDISEDFATPIDDRLVVNWDISETAQFTMTNLGDTYKIDFTNKPGEGGYLKWGGHSYRLLQVHCHAASEHTWEGAGRDVECHFVHKEATGEMMFAVTGITFSASHLISSEVVENAWLKAHIDAAANAPTTGSTTTISFPKAAGMNVQSVDDYADGNIVSDPPHLFRFARPVPANDVAGTSDVKDKRVQQALSSWRDFFHYKGSLTTPPCTQAVAWFVQRRPILVPRAQAKAAFDLFQKPYTVNGATVTKGNFREVQNEQNSQDLYKIRMDWTPARKDPVMSNQQVEEVKREEVAQVEEMCKAETKKTRDWVIALSAFFPTLFISILILSLYAYFQRRQSAAKPAKANDKANRKLVDSPVSSDFEAPRAFNRVQPAVVHMAERPSNADSLATASVADHPTRTIDTPTLTPIVPIGAGVGLADANEVDVPPSPGMYRLPPTVVVHRIELNEEEDARSEVVPASVMSEVLDAGICETALEQRRSMGDY